MPQPAAIELKAGAPKKAKRWWKTLRSKETVNIWHIDRSALAMHDDPVGDDELNVIARNFGVNHLHYDPNKHDTIYVEHKLAELEGGASNIIRRIADAVAKDESTIEFVRGDLNTLRLFLFVMSYRSAARAAQFLNGAFDELTMQSLKRHITENVDNLAATTRDVWLQDLQELVDSKFADIFENKKIYEHVRFEFTFGYRSYRLVLWRTRGDAEFITTTNGFSVIEGREVDLSTADPVVGAMYRDHLEKAGAQYRHPTQGGRGVIPWLKIYPVHPQFALVLVSNHMAKRTDLYELLSSDAQHSRFRDFPCPPATKTEYVGLSPAATAALARGDIKALTRAPPHAKSSWDFIPTLYVDGVPAEARERDRFTFPITFLTTEEVRIVNGLLLENAALPLKDPVQDVRPSAAVAFRSTRELFLSVLAYERNKTWEHKQSYAALKRALRARAMQPSIVAVALSHLVPLNMERRVLLVGGADEDDETIESVVSTYRLLCDRMRILRSPIMRETRWGPGQLVDAQRDRLAVFRALNRVHDDYKQRSVEAALPPPTPSPKKPGSQAPKTAVPHVPTPSSPKRPGSKAPAAPLAPVLSSRKPSTAAAQTQTPNPPKRRRRRAKAKEDCVP